MIGTWVDFSAGQPGGAALRAAGITGTVRYAGIGGSVKRLTAAEYGDLASHGVAVALVAESSITRDDAGYAAGVADAQALEADRIAFGMPDNTVCFAANDKSTYVQADIDYVRGFRDVLGVGRTGVYGFGPFIAAVSAAGIASYYWQAGPAPSRTGTSGIVNLWQRQGGAVAANGSDGPGTPVTEVINGVACDLNNLLIEIGKIMTTLDDSFESTYVGPNGIRSNVNLTYAQGIQNADGGQWAIRQMLAGELREEFPDGAARNVMDALKDLTSRLASVQTAVSGLTAAVAKIPATAAPVTLTDAEVGVIATQIANAVAAVATTHAAPTADEIATAVVYREAQQFAKP